MNVPDTVRHSSPQVIFEDYVVRRLQLPDDGRPGGNWPKATRADARIGGRRRAVAPVSELLGNLEGLALPVRAGVGAFQLAELLCALTDKVDQKTVMQNLLDQGIATRRGIMCSHREAPYRTRAAPRSASIRARPGSLDPAADLRADERGRPGSRRKCIESRASPLRFRWSRVGKCNDVFLDRAACLDGYAILFSRPGIVGRE